MSKFKPGDIVVYKTSIKKGELSEENVVLNKAQYIKAVTDVNWPAKEAARLYEEISLEQKKEKPVFICSLNRSLEEKLLYDAGWMPEKELIKVGEITKAFKVLFMEDSDGIPTRQ